MPHWEATQGGTRVAQVAEGTGENISKSLYGGFVSCSQALGWLGHRYGDLECETLITVAGSVDSGLVRLFTISRN